METIQLIGAILSISGSIFLLLGSIGILRMPDAYTRIQAGTKASTLGTILTLVGLGLVHPSWIGKLLLLVVFVLITNPISSHVLARAAHSINIAMSRKTVVDKLKVKKEATKSGESSMETGKTENVTV